MQMTAHPPPAGISLYGLGSLHAPDKKFTGHLGRASLTVGCPTVHLPTARVQIHLRELNKFRKTPRTAQVRITILHTVSHNPNDQPDLIVRLDVASLQARRRAAA